MEVRAMPASLALSRKVEVHYDDEKSESLDILYLWSRFMSFPRMMIGCF